MIRIGEGSVELPWYRPVPLTDLPLIYHRDHLFPYTSAGDTRDEAEPRAFRMVTLDNGALRVEIAPGLGGRVYGLYDHRIGREILFRNPVVKPARVLPVWNFLSGGIEFNFPIAHSPTSAAEVGCATGRVGDYGYVRVGEREARTGMEWVVELGLIDGVPMLVQRTAVRNQSWADQPWMLWSICALRSTAGTEIVHPPHRVTVHDDGLGERDWPGEGMEWERSYGRMTALFWRPGGGPEFGVYHHDLGFGLRHLADPALLPGKKLWTYGYGAHRDWGRATTVGGGSYLEIESGALPDQGERPRLPRGSELRFEEYWVPALAREEFGASALPRPALPAWDDPWLGWGHSAWQREWETFRAGAGPLPGSTVPTGLELESALRAALARGEDRARESLALWLAFRGRPLEALDVVAGVAGARARRIAGLIRWRGLGRAADAVADLEAGPLEDPVAAVELDRLYVELGMIDRRAALLARAPDHRLVWERRIDLALVAGRVEEALRWLGEIRWPREHQRYVRGDLWRRASAMAGREGEPVPEWLGEDDLAEFGAYWAD